jgi:putative DNA primase/helicase
MVDFEENSVATENAYQLFINKARANISLEFLGAILPEEGVYYIALFKEGHKFPTHKAYTDLAMMADAFDSMADSKSLSVYHACASYQKAVIETEDADGKIKRKYRVPENWSHARSFWVDIDCGEAKHAKGAGYLTKEDATQAIFGFAKEIGWPKPMLVDSGNGIHAYWPLTKDIPHDKWVPVAKGLKATLAHHGVLADPTRTADFASILRPVGSFNRKNGGAKAVGIIAEGTAGEPNELEAALMNYMTINGMKAIKGAPKKEYIANNLNADHLAHLPQYPEIPVDANLMADKCKQVAAMRDTKGDLGYESWRRVIGLLTFCENGRTLAEDWSSNREATDHEQLDWDVKYDTWASGPTLCETLEEHCPGNCTGCPMKGKIKTPLVLGRKSTYNQYAGASQKDDDDITLREGDIATGHAFAQENRGRSVYLIEPDRWLQFDPAIGWKHAAQNDIALAAKNVVAKLLQEASAEILAHPEWNGRSKRMLRAMKASNLPSMCAMVEMSKSEPGMSCSANEFDADPMQLGVQNGILDLKTGRLLSPQAYIRVSKRCAVTFDPEAACPRFEQFMEEVLPCKDVRDFVQRWIGYCLTGRSSEKKFVVLLGEGDNGKSILIEFLNWLLGSYAIKIDTEMLMNHPRSPQGPSPDIVALQGKRLVYANETSEGQRIADARVKDLTGGDTLTGRVPYGKSAITFQPTHKLMLVGNHKPVITDTSSGMWGRIVLIPFDVVIPKERRDRHLLDKLKLEGSGILNWMLAGLAKYLESGLAIPPALEGATAAYREEQDMVGEWVGDHGRLGIELKCKSKDAYKAFQRWCRDNGHGQPSKTTLTRRLGGVQIKQSPCRNYYLGFELNAEGMKASVAF